MPHAARFTTPPRDFHGPNLRSHQALGLVGWWPSIGSRAHRAQWLRDFAAGGATGDLSPTGSPGPAFDAALGPGVAISPGNCLEGSDAGLPTGAAPRSVAQWVRIDGRSSTSIYTFQCGTLAVNQWLALGVYDFGTGPRWMVSNAAVAATSPAAATSVGETCHVVFTWDGGTGWRLYVNGSDVSATGWPGTPLDTQPGSVSLASYQPLGATIFDTRVYDRALSPAEVWRLFDPASRWELYATRRRPRQGLLSASAGFKFRRTTFPRAGSRGVTWVTC